MLEVMTPEFKDIDILPGFVSLQYSDLFDSVGEFELWCKISDRNCKLLKEYNIINLGDGLAGEIGYVNKSRQQGQAPLLHIKGAMITGLLDTKIIWGLFTDYNKPEDIMANIVKSQCIAATDVSRRIPGLVMGTKATTSISKLEYQNTGGEIIASLTKLAQPYGLGYEIYFDYMPNNPTVTFNILNGIDRSVDQDQVEDVTLSVSNGNISGSDYIKNALTVKNTALVAGAGEGKDRIYITVSAFPNLLGTYRREVFVDARDLQQKDEEGNPIPLQTYLSMLKERGTEKLTEYAPKETFTVDLAGNNLYIPGQHFFKGDIVTVMDEEMGIKANIQVKGIKRSFDENGQKVSAILGDIQPKIIDIVKRRESA